MHHTSLITLFQLGHECELPFFPTFFVFMFADATEFKEVAFCFSKWLPNSSTMFSLTATAKKWAQYFSSLKCLQSLSQIR